VKKYVFRALFLGVLLCILAGASTFFIWQHQPAQGKITNPLPVGTDVKAAADVLEDYSARFFSTKVVSSLHLKNRNEIETASIMGQYLFTDKNPYNTDQLAITIGAAKSSAVGEISPVQLRRSRPDQYVEAPTEAGFPESSVVFIKEDNYEKSVFWTHEGKYAGVVVSGGIDKRAQLENALKVAVTYWTWN